MTSTTETLTGCQHVHGSAPGPERVPRGFRAGRTLPDGRVPIQCAGSAHYRIAGGGGAWVRYACPSHVVDAVEAAEAARYPSPRVEKFDERCGRCWTGEHTCPGCGTRTPHFERGVAVACRSCRVGSDPKPVR